MEGHKFYKDGLEMHPSNYESLGHMIRECDYSVDVHTIPKDRAYTLDYKDKKDEKTFSLADLDRIIKTCDTLEELKFTLDLE